MEKRLGLEASIAIADVVGLCDADIVAAYPITPQTHVVEHLSELVANGHLDAEFVPVESEHAAMSACCGAAAAGARTFTATSAQGLALMHEILFIASALRLPIVMAVANRSLSGPISIWNDHSDVMAERDVGWVQIFAENAQEAADLTIWSFRLAEDRRVSLPVMMNFDGFILTHTIEPVLMPDKEMVQAFLPPWEPLLKLDVDNPISMGPVGIPDIYTEAKQVQQHLLTQSYGPIVETLDEFAKHFKRAYKPVETYRCDDAEVLLCTMGALGETAMEAVDRRRKRGQKIGLVRIRLWRPFPFEDLYRAVGNVPVLGVMDRAISFGGPVGPVASEIKAAFYHREQRPKMVEFVAGLGGRDVPLSDFDKMFDSLYSAAETGKIPAPAIIGLRE
jgi:pyruvate ferredoxin oxidoreductase alpha subunit